MQRNPFIKWIVVERSAVQLPEPKQSWPKLLWSRFVRWLITPIPFPFELPITDGESPDYNLETDATSQQIRKNDERRSPKPRSVAGSR
jgi:hypothetical protein